MWQRPIILLKGRHRYDSREKAFSPRPRVLWGSNNGGRGCRGLRGGRPGRSRASASLSRVPLLQSWQLQVGFMVEQP